MTGQGLFFRRSVKDQRRPRPKRLPPTRSLRPSGTGPKRCSTERVLDAVSLIAVLVPRWASSAKPRQPQPTKPERRERRLPTSATNAKYEHTRERLRPRTSRAFHARGCSAWSCERRSLGRNQVAPRERLLQRPLASETARASTEADSLTSEHFLSRPCARRSSEQPSETRKAT